MNLSRLVVENNILLRKVSEKLGIPEEEWKLGLGVTGERLSEQVILLTNLGYSKDDIVEILGVSRTTVGKYRRQDNYKKLGEELIDFD